MRDNLAKFQLPYLHIFREEVSMETFYKKLSNQSLLKYSLSKRLCSTYVKVDTLQITVTDGILEVQKKSTRLTHKKGRKISFVMDLFLM